MDKKQFWQLIENSFDESVQAHSETLKAMLTGLSADEIATFFGIFEELDAAAYRWDLWAVAYIVHGGCSDDCFMDFRAMLIRRGQKFYNSMLEKPEDTALAFDLKDDWEEMFGYCIPEAYEEVCGRPLLEASTTSSPSFPAQPVGKRWEEDELERLFPRLWAKFG